MGRTVELIQDENYTPTHLIKVLNSNKGSAIRSEYLDLNELKPAPAKWNEFSPVSQYKRDLMKQSILQNKDLDVAISVWEQYENGEHFYMILAGHNRVSIYKELLAYAIEHDIPELIESFSRIRAEIYTQTQIDANRAQQIIINTNYTQRDLTHMEKNRCIIKKFTLLGTHEDTKYLSKTAKKELTASDFNVSSRQIYNYMNLCNLILEWQSILDENEITLDMALRIVKLCESKQRYLFENHLDTIIDLKSKAEKVVSKIKDKTNDKYIDELFDTALKEASATADMINFSFKVAFDLSTEESKMFRALSREDRYNLQDDIEKLVKKKYLRI